MFRSVSIIIIPSVALGILAGLAQAAPSPRDAEVNVVESVSTDPRPYSAGTLACVHVPLIIADELFRPPIPAAGEVSAALPVATRERAADLMPRPIPWVRVIIPLGSIVPSRTRKLRGCGW